MGTWELTEARWSTVPDDRKLGLRYDQSRSLYEKYRRVLVIPIFRKDHGYPDPEFIGCIAVDAPAAFRDFDVITKRIRSLSLASALQLAERIDVGG